MLFLGEEESGVRFWQSDQDNPNNPEKQKFYGLSRVFRAGQ